MEKQQMFINFNQEEHPHIRYNPLKDEWLAVSPHRTKRPWNGKIEKIELVDHTNRFDSNNPLCPGAIRPNGVKNPDYTDTYVFDNDFPAFFEYNMNEKEFLKQQEASSDLIQDELFQIKPIQGVCKVMCFHPYSDLSLATMNRENIIVVINKWIEVYRDLATKYSWVQIFENKGQLMGCSNPHPHCQIWASDFIPNEIRVEDIAQFNFYKRHNGKVMLVEYLKRELVIKERIIIENDNWVVLVPYWAFWPFETYIIPKRHVSYFDQLTSTEVANLADAMKRLLVKYDNLFECSFPYSMGFHFAPSGKQLNNNYHHWQLFVVYHPPLLRSATIKKFMVGYELLAQKHRDLTPEKAAEQLREASDIHYLSRN